MTTGRINQVTIFWRPPRTAAGVDGTRRGASTRRRLPVGREPSGSNECAIQLPRPNSPERGPLEHPPPEQRGSGIVAPRGGCPSPVTPRGGYRYTGVPPSVSESSDGQRPTIHRLHRCRMGGPPGLQRPPRRRRLLGRRRAAVPHDPRRTAERINAVRHGHQMVRAIKRAASEACRCRPRPPSPVARHPAPATYNLMGRAVNGTSY